MAYYLGIDGGGSKTKCALGDETSLLATVSTGPSNITRVGETGARQSLHQAIREACAAVRITPVQVQRACIGIAGAGRDEVANIVREIIAEVIAGEVEVVADMPIALEAAFGAGPGVVVIAGTGSFAYGRSVEGRTARAGGWGFAVSDEGSAHWIGRTAVSALLRTIDELCGPENEVEATAQTSPLFPEFEAAWKLHSFGEFVRTANANPDFAALFPPILAAAERGTTLAGRVITQAGEELAQLAAIAVRRLFPQDSVSPSVIPLAMAGGVFRNSDRVREVFWNEIHKVDSRVELNPQVVEPVTGALQMAREAGRKS